MIRRHFVHQIAAFGAAGLATGVSHGGEVNTDNSKNVTFNVKGFTCVTCAIGLEVVLRQQKGVVKAKASYPVQTVAIAFDASQTSVEALSKFINETTGFTVSEAAS